jgi:hypothetical protein
MKLLHPFNLFRQALKFYNVEGSLPLFDAITKISLCDTEGIPKDLISLGLKMHLRGLLNTVAIQSNRDWVWPFWVERQFNPRYKGFVPRSHTLSHMNLTQRNWTILGPIGNSHRCVVDPRGLVTPWQDGWSLDCWVGTEKGLHTPARLDEVRQRIHNRYPQMKTTFEADQLEVKIRSFATLINGGSFLVIRTRITNCSAEPRLAKLYFSIRPYNPEGISLIRRLDFVEDHVWKVDGQTAVILMESPKRVYCSNLKEGDVSFFADKTQNRTHIACEFGMATGLVQYTLNLKSEGKGAKKDLLLLLTLDPAQQGGISFSSLASFDYPAVRHEFRAQWEKKLSESTQIQFPQRRLTDSFLVNRAHLQSFDRGSIMTPGALTYSLCWIRDSAFMIHALDKLGFHDQAREKLLDLSGRQEKDGYFVSQEGEWDSNGLVIWAVLEHFKLTGDKQFLSDIYPAVARGAEWIEHKRRGTTGKPSSHSGLLPAGISAEHLGPTDHYYWDNFWSLAGLHGAAFAAGILGKEKDAARFSSNSSNYWQAIDHSLQFAERQLGLACLPASPYRRMDSGAIGSLCAVYPLGLLNASHPRVANTIKVLEDRFLVGEGFFQEHFHSGVNCYLSAHLAQCYLASGNPRVWRIVRYLLKNASSTYTWPEAFHPITKGGCMGEGHHGWATAEWLLLLRNLLFLEERENLCVTRLLLPDHLKCGNTFSVRSAPSYFGRVSFKILADKKEVWLELGEELQLSTAKHLIWHLPFRPQKTFIDGQISPMVTTAIRITPKTSKVVVVK